VKNNDIERQGLLEKDGLRVLRFTNNELIHAYEKVIEDLNILIQKMIDDKKR
jgi:very-short-patch-repair endonuclease